MQLYSNGVKKHHWMNTAKTAQGFFTAITQVYFYSVFVITFMLFILFMLSVLVQWPL